jgi:hypothetical protein
VARSQYGQRFELENIVSKSPRAGAKPPKGAVILLPFEKGVKADLSGWKNPDWKAKDNGVMECAKGKGSNKTHREFSDIKQLHVEFKLPLEPHGRGQHVTVGGFTVSLGPRSMRACRRRPGRRMTLRFVPLGSMREAS